MIEARSFDSGEYTCVQEVSLQTTDVRARSFGPNSFFDEKSAIPAKPCSEMAKVLHNPLLWIATAGRSLPILSAGRYFSWLPNIRSGEIRPAFGFRNTLLRGLDSEDQRSQGRPSRFG